MNTRGTRAKCETTEIINPLDAASTKNKLRGRTTKSFLYSSFARRKRENKELTLKNEENKNKKKIKVARRINNLSKRIKNYAKRIKSSICQIDATKNWMQENYKKICFKLKMINFFHL
jgi:hypothetical protein